MRERNRRRGGSEDWRRGGERGKVDEERKGPKGKCDVERKRGWKIRAKEGRREQVLGEGNGGSDTSKEGNQGEMGRSKR